MKLQYETVQASPDSSFTLLHYTQVQQGGLLWHYHPEYELVYIPEGSGRRHIGQHRSRFEDGELVLIGPNLPHLSFSFGQQGAFEEIVVQLRADFLGADFWQRPELGAIQQLLLRSHQGLSFGPATRASVGAALRRLLSHPPLPRLLTLLEVLGQLAQAGDAQLLNASRLHLNGQEQQRLSRVYDYLRQHFRRPIDVQAVAAAANLSVPAFCRYFKKTTRLTLTEFLQENRVNHACSLLLDPDRPITEVCYESGFNNLSHFNKTFRKHIGLSPSDYRRQKASNS
ncbi:AraC family transcriptional regulator [Hymenobacter saemangeumensis]|uniref:AraC family transcriptional regulator n=1 Tax=Hymenobacter saemangeumensis TaxID=1084522 RepID=A0ABP8IKR8_9BACT